MRPFELPRIIGFLLRLRAHVVLIFILAYFLFCRSLDGAVSALEIYAGAGFAALLQLGYLANKLYDRAEDAYNGEQAFLPGSAAAWQRGLAAAFAAVACAMCAAAPRLIPILAYSAAAAFAYSHPAVRLKGYPLFKPLVNTSNFFLVAVMAPFLLADGGAWAYLPGLLAGTWRLLLVVLCLTVLFDVRDARGDALAGLRTLPTVLGRAAVLWAIILLTLASGLTALASGRNLSSAAQLTITAFAAGALKERGRRYYDALALIELVFLFLLF